MKGLAPHTRQVFEAVSRLDCIKPYLLVGGTALSLHPFCCSLLLALLLLGFCACGHGSYPSVLLRADSLASVAPDSARVLLARWADSAGHAPERVRMYHRLLTIKAADKAYVRHTSDSLIKKVVAYYEDGGDKSLLPEAYYYAGRVYRDLGDAPQALDYFERAADVLPPRGQEVLAGKIYSQTGTLFLYQQMYEEALEMVRRAYAYDVKAGDVRGQVFALRDITNVYQRMEKLDSTLAYIQKAHVLASECGNVDMLSLVQGQRLSLYLQLQKYDSAEVCLREAFKHVHKANHSGLYSMASQLYNYTGRLANVKEVADNPLFSFIEHDVIRPLDVSEPVDQIYNLACPASPVHYQGKAAIYTTKTCVFGAINMLELALKHHATILQASTSEVYGEPLVHPQPESYRGNVNPDGIRACYDEGKRCAESLFFDYYREKGADIKVIRIFNTYGPKMNPDDGRVVSNMICQALQGKDMTVYGDGSQTRSFCYVDDLIEAMVRMMNSPKGFTGPVNTGNPGEFTIRELAHIIIKKLGGKGNIVYKPLPKDDPTQRRPDITLAKEKLGWEPKIALDEGLDKTIAYFQQVLGGEL